MGETDEFLKCPKNICTHLCITADHMVKQKHQLFYIPYNNLIISIIAFYL